MSIAKQYTTEIVHALQYLPIWLPIKKLDLGSIGRIENHIFEVTGNIANLPVPFTHSQDRPAGIMRYNSNKGVSVQVKAAGAAPALGSALATADAGVSIKFSRGQVVVFEASNCKVEAISDLSDLGQRLIKLYRTGQWDANQYIVTEIVRADAATILISSNAGASVELKIGGKINTAGFSLADVDAQFSVARHSDMGYQIVAERGLTPLFKAWRVDPGFFSDSFKPALMQEDDSEGEDLVPNIPVFSQMAIGDLWPDK